MADVSTLFDLLSARPRRRLLVALSDVETLRVPDDLPDVDERSGPSPNGVSGQGGDDRDDGRSLQWIHNHLPKLDDEGVIDWDRDGGTVSRGPAFDEVRPLVDLLLEHDDVLPGPFD